MYVRDVLQTMNVGDAEDNVWLRLRCHCDRLDTVEIYSIIPYMWECVLSKLSYSFARIFRFELNKKDYFELSANSLALDTV
jgi:hypothetical protein